MGRCINEASAVIWIHGPAGSPVAQGFIDLCQKTDELCSLLICGKYRNESNPQSPPA